MLQGYDELKGHLRMANHQKSNMSGMDKTALMVMKSWSGWVEGDINFAPTVSHIAAALVTSAAQADSDQNNRHCPMHIVQIRRWHKPI